MIIHGIVKEKIGNWILKVQVSQETQRTLKKQKIYKSNLLYLEEPIKEDIMGKSLVFKTYRHGADILIVEKWDYAVPFEA